MVNHPVRRRIINLLMVARSAGMVTIIFSLILSLGTENQTGLLTRLIWIVGVSLLLLVLTPIQQVDRPTTLNNAMLRFDVGTARQVQPLPPNRHDHGSQNQ